MLCAVTAKSLRASGETNCDALPLEATLKFVEEGEADEPDVQGADLGDEAVHRDLRP